MAKKKASAKPPSGEPVIFSYFADSLPVQAVHAREVSSLSEEEQIAQNVRVFLEKRPPSPWAKRVTKGARSHPLLNFLGEEG